VDVQNPILEIGGDVRRVDIIGQRKTALETAVGPLDPVESLPLVFLLGFSLARDLQGPVFDPHFKVFLLHLGHLGLHEVFAILFDDVDQGRPIADRQRFLAIRPCGHQLIHAGLQVLDLANRVPAVSNSPKLQVVGTSERIPLGQCAHVQWAPCGGGLKFEANAAPPSRITSSGPAS
jgi:hypothetical protein